MYAQEIKNLPKLSPKYTSDSLQPTTPFTKKKCQTYSIVPGYVFINNSNKTDRSRLNYNILYYANLHLF